MSKARNIEVSFSAGGRFLKMEVAEYSGKSAIEKVKAIIMALAHSNALKSADCFEVTSGFDEDFE